MFVCSRCGSSYSSRHIGVEHCPRCRLRDKVESPLAFKPFDLSNLEVTSLKGSERSEGSDSAAAPSASAISSRLT